MRYFDEVLSLIIAHREFRAVMSVYCCLIDLSSFNLEMFDSAGSCTSFLLNILNHLSKSVTLIIYPNVFPRSITTINNLACHSVNDSVFFHSFNGMTTF